MMMMMLISLERLCSKEIWKQLRVLTLENLVLSIIIVCMKKLRFSSPLTATKVQDQGAPGASKDSPVSGQNVIRQPMTSVFFVINISFLLWAVSLSCVAEVSIFTVVLSSNRFFIKSLFIVINLATSVISWIDERMVKVLMSKQKLVPSYPTRKSVKKLCPRFAGLQHSENNQRKTLH